MIIAPGAVTPPAASLPVGPGAEPLNRGFAVPGMPTDPGQGAKSQVSGSAPLSITGAMLALQEQLSDESDHPAKVADREARRHGRTILDALKALSADLLADPYPVEALSRLALLANAEPTVHDPALFHILSAIRLRARLEVLRHTRCVHQKGGADCTEEPQALMTDP